MDVELVEIQQFLARYHPFDRLPPEVLASLPKMLELRYVRCGTELFSPGTLNHHLYTIRAGAVEVRDRDGNMLSRLGEGDTFGGRALLRRGPTLHGTTAIEDTLLYLLPADEFYRLCEGHPQFSYHFGSIAAERLREGLSVQGAGEGANLMTVPIAQMLSRPAVTLTSGAAICEAAKQMTEARISSILVVDDGELVGVVTDRDIRSRCVAAEVPWDRPVGDIMTRSPYTVSTKQYGFEALVAMVRYNIRHLPVMDGEQVAGMVTATDLIHRRSASAVYLVGDVFKQKSVEKIAEASQQIPKVLVNLVDAIGHVISSVGEAVTCRLLQLAEEALGPPPVPYAWMAAGSLARFEQTARSDQDNGLLLSEDYRAEQHGAYFEQLTRRVCDGLHACGYVYCPGDVMAVNPKWRQPLSAWKRYFEGWIMSPEPKALMHSSIFFDLRCLFGDQRLFRELQAHVLGLSRTNRIFLAYMASNALQYQPPLGFFRNFVLVRGGEHAHTLNLKHKGVVPIVDLARIYALAEGLAAVNTRHRLEVLGGKGEVSAQGAADLRDALELISMVRLRHQVRLIRAGRPPDNYMAPDALSNLERSHLKDAFSIVQTMQASLGQRYQVGRFG